MRMQLVSAAVIILGLPFAGLASDQVSGVAAALEAAGENRAELQKVLDHYEKSADTLKSRAARWLIVNMEGHGYVTYALVDTVGDTVAFDAEQYPSYDSLLQDFDRMESDHGRLDFKSAVKAKDIEEISSEFLIENIDLAFEAWRTRPWARDLPYEAFLEGVLPYRGSNEPLEPWRREFLDRYADLPSRMRDSTDPIEAAALINDDIKSWFGFDQRYYYHPTDQGLSEMKASGLGRCEDMTNLTIYAMRANGIAVTSDYTPHWANSGNNHAWNAIILPDRMAIPFMGAERNPGEYELTRKPAKVYRKSFSQQPGNLAFLKDEDRQVPPWLGGKSYRDVTASYGPARDVTVALYGPVPQDVKFAYLAVFNGGEWKAIHWGELEGTAVTFTDMLPNIAYLPMFYIEEDLVAAGQPFILETDGNRRVLEADTEESIEVTLAATTQKTMDASSESVERSHLIPGTEYELYYWADKEWQSLGRAEAGAEPLKFVAPSGGLYWLVADGSDRDERIFTYDEDHQVWW